MITVFDLVSGETEENALHAPSPSSHSRRQQVPEIRTPAITEVLPQLQEHRFADDTTAARELTPDLAQLDCEAFVRSMERN